ncbi:M20 family metallopeptidase [Acidicapsa dinghuensis]|uniref:M20 family metallopeptidase n=1 Tax=Acidicapsa dinghuensis TaxID=2218256 RepID=A0ABW1EK70_9BACT|nr:M20 family metallopeptidase [Acidicapsa dinghuensis]
MASIPMRALLAGARRKQPGLLNLAKRLVLCESPSDSKPAVDACMDLAAAHAKTLGGRIKRHRQGNYGDVLELRFGPRNPAGRILLLGHLDTVWALGTFKTMPHRIAPDANGHQRLWGPGTLDMKVGVAMAFTAIELLIEAEALTATRTKQPAGTEIILLLNSEEEVGSPVSRPITESLAHECSAVYVLEPAQVLAYKTARKGTGNWRLTVHGVASHAGVDFTRGRSAILELARQLERISAFTDLKRGVTVNAGVIGGGTKSNVVPAEAWAEIDARIARNSDGRRIERKFAALKPTRNSGCTLTLEGGINRPPMERTRGTVQLFRRAQALAAELGHDFDPITHTQLEEASTGGASDGNFTSALGIPTLDGMGAVGEGAHATHESVLIDHLAPRTALLAAMLAE